MALNVNVVTGYTWRVKSATGRRFHHFVRENVKSLKQWSFRRQSALHCVHGVDDQATERFQFHQDIYLSTPIAFPNPSLVATPPSSTSARTGNAVTETAAATHRRRRSWRSVALGGRRTGALSLIVRSRRGRPAAAATARRAERAGRPAGASSRVMW